MPTPIIAPPKPKNARSKRAAEAREPVLIEKEAKTAIFVRASSISERVKVALSELNQLKKPHSISFSKSNQLRPFEDSSSLQFWSSKNDASLFLIGSHTKKRPNALTWARCFAGEVMELLEVGVEEVMSMASFKGLKSSPGSIPLFHFSSISSSTNLWETHPTYIQFKSILLDFFRGVEMDAVSLKGLERVISVTIGGKAGEENEGDRVGVETAVGNLAKGKEVDNLMGLRMTTGGGAGTPYTEEKSLPLVHFRTYTLSFLRSGLPTPIASLSPHGPHLTFSMRRSQLPSEEMWKASLKKSVKKVTASKNGKKNKNIDIDLMGDKVGRIYLERQDMSTLQSRKMLGLKRSRDPKEEGADGEKKEKREKKEKAPPQGGDQAVDFSVAEVTGKVGGGEGRKRAAYIA